MTGLSQRENVFHSLISLSHLSYRTRNSSKSISPSWFHKTRQLSRIKNCCCKRNIPRHSVGHVVSQINRMQVTLWRMAWPAVLCRQRRQQQQRQLLKTPWATTAQRQWQAAAAAPCKRRQLQVRVLTPSWRMPLSRSSNNNNNCIKCNSFKCNNPPTNSTFINSSSCNTRTSRTTHACIPPRTTTAISLSMNRRWAHHPFQ